MTVVSWFGRGQTEFVRAARARGLSRTVSRVLERAAGETCAGDPARLLDSRELFERTARQAVMGDAGNLELSFELVDRLAQAVELLKLGRVSDVPDPFRRVWVSDAEDQRTRGVVFRHEQDQLAIFCPPGGRRLGELGSLVTVSYRGFASSVDYELLVDDSVRLPGALVLHLSHPSGSGRIGRHEDRYPVELSGRVRLVDRASGAALGASYCCEVRDVSLGGLGLMCEADLAPAGGFEREAWVDVCVDLTGPSAEDPELVDLARGSIGSGELTLRAAVCLARTAEDGRLFLGTELRDVEDGARAAFEAFVQAQRRGLARGGEPDPGEQYGAQA